MNEIRVEDDCLAIGALVTYRALEESELVAAHCGLLVDALGYVGAPAVRNRGTLGGSLVHADPTAEAPTVVAALGGELTIAGSSGERTARFAEFCQGAYRVELAPTEIVTEVRVPKLLDGAVWGFAEVSHRFGSSAQMAAAAALHLDGERVVAAWISIAGLAGVPTRARIAEQALSGQAAIADEFDKTAHVAVDELAAAGEDPVPPPARPRGCRSCACPGTTAGDGGLVNALARVELSINGECVVREVEPRRLLSDFLREDLGLTGTHVGCEHGVCGACTVHLDGRSVRSCLLFTVQAAGSEITTVEGVGGPETLHPLQEALSEHHGLQCGFCTPGMVMTALELIQRDPSPSETAIRQALAGNLCRCTGYEAIVRAIEATARRLHTESDREPGAFDG